MGKDYILGVIELVRRMLYLILLNFDFISEDKNIKLNIKNFPPLLNSLLEFQQRIDEILKLMKKRFKLKNIYLRTFFQREWIKKKIAKITRQFIKLYQKILSKPIVENFEKLESIEGLVVNIYAKKFLNDNLLIQK